MTDGENYLFSLLKLIKYDREVYSHILRFNYEKRSLAVELPRSNQMKLKLDDIIRHSLNFVNELLKSENNQIIFIRRIIDNWSSLNKMGILSKTIEKDVSGAWQGLLDFYKALKELGDLLKEQLKTTNVMHLIALIDQEKKLHRDIRRSFFAFLRFLLDTIKNIEEKKPLIAVVIPAYNEEKYIKFCLRTAINQTYPNKIIIVVDNMSTDRTLELARRYTPHVFQEQRKGVAYARNKGGNAAIKLGAEIVVFLDADSRMNRDLLEKVWESVYIDGKFAGICKTKLDEKHLKAKIFNFLHHLNRVVWKVPHTFMFSTSNLFQHNQFWNSPALGEDVEWAHRVIKYIGSHNFKVITTSWLTTSARRFEKAGYFKTIMRWAQTWPFGLITGKKDITYFDD